METETSNLHSNQSLSIIFSNLSKASEKQQFPEKTELFDQLSKKFWSGNAEHGDFTLLSKKIMEDIKVSYPEIQAEAEKFGDRGALRAVRWGQKVSILQKSLIDRYLTKGNQLIEGKELFVCEACGFIFLGNESPGLCPVCKAPSSRFIKIK